MPNKMSHYLAFKRDAKVRRPSTSFVSDFIYREGLMMIEKIYMRSMLLIAFALLLGGCATPKNAEEFREKTRNGPFKFVETFEVSRPFNDVSATLRKKASECLAVSIDWTAEFGRYRNKRSGTDTYKPTFTSNSKRAELHLQLKRSAVTEIGSPPDGNYRVVLDATPRSMGSDSIDFD